MFSSDNLLIMSPVVCFITFVTFDMIAYLGVISFSVNHFAEIEIGRARCKWWGRAL